jgi:trigger factor
MQAQLEILEKLERRLNFTVPQTDIQQAVEGKLKRIARTAKISGFRPGKAPLKIVAQHYGAAAHEEALNEVVKKSFAEALKEQQLRIAGYPRFEAKPAESDEVKFSALFEVFPEIQAIDLSTLHVEKPLLAVSEAEVDKTIEVLRKQRVRYEHVSREATITDRVIIDFKGEIDGVAFAGGSAENYAFVIGDKQMLPAFEEAVIGLKEGEEKTFDLTFPDDYHGKEVAGKTAQFTLVVKNVAAAILPEVDAELAKSLGVEDGDVEKMRAEIRKNIEREVRFRLRARTLKNVMDALIAATPIDLPMALVSTELQNVIQSTFESLKSRGVDPTTAPFPPEFGEKMKQQAENRVHLSLIMGELVRLHQLDAKPEQIKAIVNDFAESYENPAEVVQWYFESQERLAGPQNMALEDNIVEHVLSHAKVTEQPISFESLMETN